VGQQRNQQPALTGTWWGVMDGVVGLQFTLLTRPIILNHHWVPTLREAIDFSITSHFQMASLHMPVGLSHWCNRLNHTVRPNEGHTAKSNTIHTQQNNLMVSSTALTIKQQ